MKKLSHDLMRSIIDRSSHSLCLLWITRVPDELIIADSHHPHIIDKISPPSPMCRFAVCFLSCSQRMSFLFSTTAQPVYSTLNRSQSNTKLHCIQHYRFLLFVSDCAIRSTFLTYVYLGGELGVDWCLNVSNAGRRARTLQLTFSKPKPHLQP